MLDIYMPDKKFNPTENKMNEKRKFRPMGPKGFNRSLFVLFISFIFHAAVISAVLVLPLMNCSIKQPPVKINRPEPPKPPPLPDTPGKKKANFTAPMEIPEGIGDFGVDFGVEGGVEGGVVGGVLGSAYSSSDACASSPPPQGAFRARTKNLRIACMATTPPPGFNTEEYNRIYDNRFLDAMDNPLSTFSIDVDTGSYANVRRFLNNNQLPPKDAVRIEEMINYFKYDYPEPQKKHPFSISTELTACPWNTDHRLLHIGILGKQLKSKNTPPSNLVFLLDVSGSMDSPKKLPLLKASFKLLVEQLNPNDRVAVVVYAGAAGLVLPSTPGSQKEKILEAITRLEAGGSTAGGAGILLAYKIAEEFFIENGNNRIILATDGDFNIGVSNTAELVRMIEEKREKGIFLTTLGFGMGNYKDNRLEQLADKGNGNYSYIDNILEGKKVFVHDMRGTLFTIAKDVKIQVEFNPVKVKGYRLIGYENRKLQKEDFDDDKKDAGELGAGHTVTALYEIVPAGNTAVESAPLRFQESRIKKDALKSREMALVKLRYKKPDGAVSRLITRPVKWENNGTDTGSINSRFSTAVALFGMLLRESTYAGDSSFDDVLALAKGAMGKDNYGYRSEFIRLVTIARELVGSKK